MRTAPPLPANEVQRLAVLRELQLLDSAPDAAFDALVQAAAHMAGCPMALLSLVDEDRQWFKAAHGLDLRETPRHVSFCAHAICGSGLFEVTDARADPRFAGNPLVCQAPHIRFYAGVPLKFGEAMLGTLCVLDTQARQLHAAQAQALHELSHIACELLHGHAQRNRLRAEQSRLLDFGRASGDWMWETDAQLRTTWLSKEFEAATGQPVAQALGSEPGDLPLLDAGGAPHAEQITWRELLQRRLPFSRAVTEESVPRGTLVISRSAVPVIDAAGRFAGYRGTARDITAQVDATRRSRGQDALLRKLSSQVPGAIFQFKLAADGTPSYPYASQGFRDIFGIDAPPEHAGELLPVMRMLHPQDREGFGDSVRESARSLRRWQREYRIVRHDGQVRWLETRATPERLPDGSTLWHGFTADITERKEIELALRRSEERWEMAADAAGIGIAEADFASGLIHPDRRACLNHGLTPTAHGISLAQWMQTIIEPERSALQTALHEALDRHTALETRCRVRRSDGSEAMLEVAIQGRFDAQGQPVGFVSTCRDITAHAEVERLQRDKQSAERANRAKSEFLSRVSHELRTPLNGILGFAQLMSIDRVDPLSTGQQRRLESVLRAGRHLLGLINDVLDLTRIENEDFSLQPRCVDASLALADCLGLIQPLADEAGIRLPTVAMPPGGAWVSADPRALEQVLMNLLSNAIKYNRPAGAVHVDVGRAPEDDTKVRIAIRDEGRGMSAQQQANLFQPFNRLGAEHSRTEGSGLGLVICQRLVHAMGGELHVRSRSHVGSTFSIDLPVGRPDRTAAPAAAAARAATSCPPTGPRRVLYIEDEPLNVVLMEEVFRSQPSWTLRVAGDGASGLRMARELQPDLVLVDMNLPDVGGIELIGRLRGDPSTRPLPCIALSADAMREQIEAALAAGFDDYWTKPIDVPRVLADLARLLSPEPDAQP